MAPAQPLRIILVEDEALYRDMLASCLSSGHKFDVVATFANTDRALAAARGLNFDVALLDIDLPGSMDGVELGVALRQERPGLGVVLLSNQAMPQVLTSLPDEIVTGWSYLLKKSVTDLSVLERAIASSAQGLVTVDPALVASMGVQAGGLVANLPQRQRQVLELMAGGLTNAAIAEKLLISEKTLETYITQLYQELAIDRSDSSAHPRVRAVLTYLEEARSRWSASLGPGAPSVRRNAGR